MKTTQSLIKDNWFEMVVFSSVYLEFFCSKLLIEKGGFPPEEVQKMSFFDINEKLKKMGLISDDTYSKIDEVRKIRNGAVHDPRIMLSLDKSIAIHVSNLTLESLKELEPYYQASMNTLRELWQI